MKIIYALTLIAAFIATAGIAGLIILSIKSGGGSVLFPGLGIIISLPFLIVLLGIFDICLIVFCLLLKKNLDKSNTGFD